MVMTMSEHEFTFIVSGLDPHADDFADRFFEAGCDDATLMLTHGLIAVSFAREAENYTHAVVSGYRDVRKAGAYVERFEPDFLVSKSEIANRSGLTRAAISHYVAGDRGEDFPAPCARVLSKSPLWDWVEVSDWLHRNDQVSADIVVNARVSRVINWFVQKEDKIPDAEKILLEQMKGVAAEPIFA